MDLQSFFTSLLNVICEMAPYLLLGFFIAGMLHVFVRCDSSDISYVFEDENGMIDIPNEMDYYGEHSFQMQYKDTIGEPLDWLYIDADTLKQKAGRFGYFVEVVAEGEHYDYLARITKMV